MKNKGNNINIVVGAASAYTVYSFKAVGVKDAFVAEGARHVMR